VRFGKISANEFFNTVDFNNDGEITEGEFIEFWQIVKGSGHTEEEIREEVGPNLLNS
jgi:Ca2+-binding EF-hand superfamily protein